MFPSRVAIWPTRQVRQAARFKLFSTFEIILSTAGTTRPDLYYTPANKFNLFSFLAMRQTPWVVDETWQYSRRADRAIQLLPDL
jgi:hypothetical protein